jgi:hypothetical protein
MFAITTELLTTLGIAAALAMTLFTVLLRINRPTAAPYVASPTTHLKEEPSPPVDPLYADSAYILSLITLSKELATTEERLKNAQELYEYLVLHPTILLQKPGMRNVTQRKATETIRILQQNTTLPYPFLASVQRTMDAFVFTLQAITLLPSYVQ